MTARLTHKFTRRFGAAHGIDHSRLKEMLSKPDSAAGNYKGELRFWLGWAQDIAGDHAGAHESWTQAKNELESSLKEQPESYLLIGELALTEMKLGENALATTLADRGLSANPIEKDAMMDPGHLRCLPEWLPQRAITTVPSRLKEVTFNSVRRAVTFTYPTHTGATQTRSNV